MGASFAGVALAAGAGTRLAPITDTMPKPCCPVANRPLVQLALDRFDGVDADLAVNVHHGADQVVEAVAGRAHVSVERPVALGTAGAVGLLRDWIDGRPTVVVNADTWCPGTVASLVDGWDGETVRVFVPGGGRFGPRVPVVGTLLPAQIVAGLEAIPTGLYEVVWRDAQDSGRLEVVAHHGPWVDCGTPADLLAANLAALAGESVVDPSAVVAGTVRSSAIGADCSVEGEVVESVLFPGTAVAADEALARVIRWVGRGEGVQTLQLG